jgi:YHS domain-containing protein
MRAIPLVFACLFVASAAGAQTPPPQKEALDGVDPVLLLTQGKEVSGKSEFAVSRGGITYLFSSAETKNVFEKSPEKYEIQLGAACARMGPPVKGDVSDYAVVDGKIYVFGSEDCHKKFVAAPEKFLARPVPPMPAGDAGTRGQALIERAVKALGGAQALDAVNTYVETASQTFTAPNGETAAAAIKIALQFPGDIRVERSASIGERRQSSTQIANSEGAWFVAQEGRVYPQRPEQRPALEALAGRSLLPLLRARHAASFRSAALPDATIDGVAVNRVRVQNGALDVTLNLDKASGEARSLTYYGRNANAEVGDFLIVYGDVRTVAGLKLPFSETATFNGAPDGSATRKVASIDVNTPLDPALFKPPAASGK